MFFCGRLLRKCCSLFFIFFYLFQIPFIGFFFLSWLCCQWPESYLDWASTVTYNLYIPYKSECSYSDFPLGNSGWPWTGSWSVCWRGPGTQWWLSGKFSPSGASCPFSTQVCFLIWFGLSSLSHTKAPLVFFLAIDQNMFSALLQLPVSICSWTQDMHHVDLYHTALCLCFANVEIFICC